MENFYKYRQLIWEHEGAVRDCDRAIRLARGTAVRRVLADQRQRQINRLNSIKDMEVYSILHIYGKPKFSMVSAMLGRSSTHRFNEFTGWTQGRSNP